MLNEPIVTAGLIMGPRGLGTIVSMLLAGRLIGRVDIRLILFAGLVTMGWAFYAMSCWSLDVSNTTIMFVGVVQGLGQGFLMVPLSTLSLSTIGPQDRAEASGAYNLARTIGSSAGVAIVNSLFTHNVQLNHANIAAVVTPFDRQLNETHVSMFWSPFTAGGRAALDSVINQQAQLISYNDDYKILMFATLITLPLLLILRRPKKLDVEAKAPAR